MKNLDEKKEEIRLRKEMEDVRWKGEVRHLEVMIDDLEHKKKYLSNHIKHLEKERVELEKRRIDLEETISTIESRLKLHPSRKILPGSSEKSTDEDIAKE